ncbi:MAG: hypothetical protein IKB51_03960 [Clostridia bacterium]|nr:hypothetical protein [Clostridia bacterium]
MSYNRQQLVIENFGGVDLSSSPLLVNSARASYMRNLINDNGVNHKRPGWRQELKINKTCTCKDPCTCNQINGIYEYKNGTYEVLIVYAGTTFYEVKNGNKTPIYNKDGTLGLLNQRVQFFRQRERLYIIGCGDYLVYGTWNEGDSYELKRVVDTDVYVPTTIIDKQAGEFGTGETKDKINILTRKRKNHFNQEFLKSEYTFFTDTVAERINKIIFNDIELDFDFEENTIKGYQYSPSKDENDTTTDDNEKEVEVKCYSLECRDEHNMPFEFKINKNNVVNLGTKDSYDESIEGKLITKTSYMDIKCPACKATVLDYYWYQTTTTKLIKTPIIVGGIYKNESGKYNRFTINKSVFNEDMGSQSKGIITVEFDAVAEDTESSNWITKCKFGALFGAYGRADRLFLSGNPNFPNVDFHSDFEDFTYFPTDKRAEMGSDDAAITGYLRLSDSTLATFKEGFGNEPTVYYRKATEVDDNGATDVTFTPVDGSVGESCISTYCTANLAGDDIMLSENGLFGIVIPENLNNNDRYFRERDRFINTALRNGKLSDSVGIVYKNRYYLSTGDGICYVADPRFKSYLSNDIDNSFNYEWWVWDNIPARVFAIIGGELYFGTADGKICVFDGDFTDRTYDETVSGQITADKACIIYSGDIDCDICDGDEITLAGYEDKLYITKHDPDKCTFKVSLTEGGEAIGNIVDELYKGVAPSSLTMKVYCYKNVVSSWYTPVFSLGATDISKTLLSMSVTLDPRIRGRISFGYETKNVQRLLGARSGAFSFENFDFDDFSFDSGFTSSYTVKVKERHFNYVMFKFISDTNTDCAVCNFKATYIYNGRHRGTH